MFRFISSLSFLYILTTVVLIVYGWQYYRRFSRQGRPGKSFPYVFGGLAIACIAFLAINFYSPLSLHSFTNLDHHFIQHDGFAVRTRIELGRSDTMGMPANSYNRFLFERKGEGLSIKSPYSEDPFFVSTGDRNECISRIFPAIDRRLSFRAGGQAATLSLTGENQFRLQVANDVFTTDQSLRKGISALSLFRDNEGFISSPAYTSRELLDALGHIFFLNTEQGNAKGIYFFISGRLFKIASAIAYENRKMTSTDLAFEGNIDPGSVFTWGMGVSERNRNAMQILSDTRSILLHYRYPVAYPLTAENRNDWSRASQSRFLVSRTEDIQGLPSIEREGFLFPLFGHDTAQSFAPVLLRYQRGASRDSLHLEARQPGSGPFVATGNSLQLASVNRQFDWLFKTRDSFQWQFNGVTLTPVAWQSLIFGSLLFFVVGISLAWYYAGPGRNNWATQLLACIVLVLLTTRYLLYWRYKSFPPFEGLDAPSLQQLNSPWNFAIIIMATIILAVFFAITFRRQWLGKGKVFTRSTRLSFPPAVTRVLFRSDPRIVFFSAWLLVSGMAILVAVSSGMDTGLCRHLAIGLVIAYFLFLFYSYRFSPLVKETSASWWQIRTDRPMHLLVSNPVKLLLSVSVLGTLLLIDIGFGIVFLNFLLFNEFFLFANYAIGGLSSGSRRNAGWFSIFAVSYLVLFLVNLLFAPFVFRSLLQMPPVFYLAGSVLFAFVLSYPALRLMPRLGFRKKVVATIAAGLLFFTGAFFFFPKEKILDKAAMTKYRVDVMTMPVDQVIREAYSSGDGYEPVIRAAQNQWFINTFIYEENNPAVKSAGFHLLPHAPQNKGARYNAQATDLVASRFFLAEHGKWSVAGYLLLLLLPVALLASFYKLYPDFTNRTNERYPLVTSGFSLMNYLLITALLVILAATGKYIFFGQDLPFGSILSKQSILFPSILFAVILLMFRKIPQEYYSNRVKLIPGIAVFAILFIMLFFVKPLYNTGKTFNAPELAQQLDAFIQLKVQPMLDEADSTRKGKMTIAQKDRQFSALLNEWLAGQMPEPGEAFFYEQLRQYAKADPGRHLDQRRLLYLDISSGEPRLTVNENYFRVDPPPHLQQAWKGNVYSDTSIYNCYFREGDSGIPEAFRFAGSTGVAEIGRAIVLHKTGTGLFLQNRSSEDMEIATAAGTTRLKGGDSLRIPNPWEATAHLPGEPANDIRIEPDAFMKNFYVNGSRYYVYPMADRFVWARNFAETVASEYSAKGQFNRNAVLSIDYSLMDSLQQAIRGMMQADTAYGTGAEYGICIADGNGRLIAMADDINGLPRPDPNDKPAFNASTRGRDGWVSPSLQRRQLGNLNLLRLNPGPGSTLKPVVFAAIASQLDIDWDALAAQGFEGKQEYFGGQKVAPYDFEKNNGVIRTVTDYLRYSDNYYHSNVLLLGSYPRQQLKDLLTSAFTSQRPAESLHWPWFSYAGKQYWLDGFRNWPGYDKGEAHFGTDSSFVSVGLYENFGIYTRAQGPASEIFCTCYDSSLFLGAGRKSAFLLPEYALFDQTGNGIHRNSPYDVFANCFRGHVKGSSQVMVSPSKMVEAYGRLVSQNREYHLTLDPYASQPPYEPFTVDESIAYSRYQQLMRGSVFTGLAEVLTRGTAARLGSMLPENDRYHYYAKTGTTGDNAVRTKSKLLAIVISQADLTDPGVNLKKNKFYTVYFTLQNGPAKQNEEFQARVLALVRSSRVFREYMGVD